MKSDSGYVAHAISDHLTRETGIIVAFESAIVPKWKDSKISFKNVYISRRPKEIESQLSEVERGRRAEARFDIGHGSLHFHEDDYPILAPVAPIYEDASMSMFDLNVDSIDVTLSLTRWLDGKGLVQSAEVRGVRGVLGRCDFDQRSLTFLTDNLRSTERNMGSRQASGSSGLSPRSQTWRFPPRVAQT